VVGGRPTFFYVFNVFLDLKKHDFLRFLSCCTRFLEHWLKWIAVGLDNVYPLRQSVHVSMFLYFT